MSISFNNNVEVDKAPADYPTEEVNGPRILRREGVPGPSEAAISEKVVHKDEIDQVSECEPDIIF